MAKIFIVEDDIALREELSLFLSSYGYECESSDDFQNMRECVLACKADLILLDLNLPHYDGHYICREIRQHSGVPIIVVTSRNHEMDELMSMNLGADDFITKPYNTQVLLAHIQAVLRRSSCTSDQQMMRYEGVTLNLGKSTVCFQEKEMELTKNELRILALLMNNKGVIVSRDEIMDELWQTDSFIDDNTLTVNINRLRKKLEDLGIREFIQTKRGQGYRV